MSCYTCSLIELKKKNESYLFRWAFTGAKAEGIGAKLM